MDKNPPETFPPPPGGKITIAIVEDDSRIRWGLSAILQEEADFECVGEFASAEEALKHLSKLNPKVVIMDVNLPGMNGIECVRRLTAGDHPPQVIMLTVRQDSEIIFDSLAAGEHVPDGIHELAGRWRLEQVTAGSGGERVEDDLGVLPHR